MMLSRRSTFKIHAVVVVVVVVAVVLLLVVVWAHDKRLGFRVRVRLRV